MHDRELAGHHRGGALHPAGRHRGSRWCGASGQRPIRRCSYRRRPGDLAQRAGTRRAAAMTERFALVALPLPLATPYTYRIPETLGDRVAPGARVVVPVRRRELIGLVVAVDTDPPAAAAKDVLAVPDPEPALSPALL